MIDTDLERLGAAVNRVNPDSLIGWGELEARPDDPVLLVAPEDFDAARGAFVDHCVLSWRGDASRVDWSALGGRSVTVWIAR